MTKRIFQDVRQILLPLVLIAMFPAGDAESREAKAPPETVAYVGGAWLDLSGSVPDWSVETRYARGGVFLAGRPDHVDRRIDLAGLWIVPPLSESHNHAVEGGWSRETANELLRQGVFYYRNPSNVASEANANRSYWARPDTIDVTFSHGALTGPEDHPVPLYRRLAGLYEIPMEELDGRAYHVVPDIAALGRRWPAILGDRPDFIKIILLNSRGDDGAASGGLTVAVAREVVKRAHAAGLTVMAHIWTAGDAATAVEIGVDELAHLPGYSWGNLPRASFVVDEDLARQIAQSGTVVNTTAVVASENDDPWQSENWQLGSIASLQRDNLRRLLDAGAQLALGTDQSRPTIDEVDYLRALRFTDDATLLRFWIEGRTRLFPLRNLTFGPGGEASFVALSCNPFASFDCIRTPMHLEKQGISIQESEQ